MEQYSNDQNMEQNQGINQMSPTAQTEGNEQELWKDIDLDQRGARRIISRAGLALFFMSVGVLAAQFGMDALFNRVNPKALTSDWYAWVVTAVSMLGIGLPIFVLIIRGIPNSPKGEIVKLKPHQFIMIFFICAAAMYITNFLSSLLTIAIAFLKGDKELVNPIAEAMMNSNYLLSLLYAVVVAPIIEEVIFRKLLLDKFRRFGDITAILMTGIAFGLFHMNLSQMFYAAVLGFIFAYVTIKTNTIRYSILLHMMINFIGTAALPVATSGNLLAALLLGQWVIASIITGTVFFILMLKKISFNKALYTPDNKSVFIINTGTILFLLTCIIFITMVTVM